MRVFAKLHFARTLYGSAVRQLRRGGRIYSIPNICANIISECNGVKYCQKSVNRNQDSAKIKVVQFFQGMVYY